VAEQTASESTEPEVTGCERCGARVADSALHKRWHDVDLPEQIRRVGGEGASWALTGVPS